jgi:hypothetical protein
MRSIFLAMVIEPNQIKGKPRKVGKVGSHPVWEMESKGGLSMVTVDREGKLETIGSGPLSAIARHIAENREKDIVWTEIRKSDYVDPQHFQHLLPEYEDLTDRLRERQGF